MIIAKEAYMLPKVLVLVAVCMAYLILAVILTVRANDTSDDESFDPLSRRLLRFGFILVFALALAAYFFHPLHITAVETFVAAFVGGVFGIIFFGKRSPAPEKTLHLGGPRYD